ncbi:MAG: arsenic resistance protein, partial [Candidatus Methanomethylophilaceae archaeon]|nr:arsenic resistance protein [Candidatus Methanomethylophilaceae archaeon]
MNAAWLHPVIMLAAAGAGLAVGSAFGMDHGDSEYIEPFLMAMLFLVFLSVDVSTARRAFEDRRFLFTALAVNFVWTPLFAFLLSIGFFSESVDARTGLIMLLVTPCTDWYLVFTGMAKGNVSLSSALLPVNLFLQVLLLPLYVTLFTGRDAGFDAASMLLDTAYVLAVPLAAAVAVRLAVRLSSRLGGAVEAVNGRTDNLQLLFLCLAIAVMFGAESATLFGNLDVLLRTLVPLILFFAVNLLLATKVGKAVGLSYDDTTSLVFTSLARNSPL